MSREIFQNVAKRQAQGLMFHSDMADYYNFLNLKGLKDFHDCQFIEECETFRKIKNYFIEHYHQTLRLDDIDSFQSLIPIEWDKKTSMDVDKDTIKKLTKKSLESYLGWESETLMFYRRQADLLFDEECYDGYQFVTCVADEVEIEKAHIISTLLDLQTVDFDINAIKGFNYKLKHHY